MHPDLMITAYRQQERELQRRLLQQAVVAERTAGGPARVQAHRLPHLRLHRRATTQH